MAPPRWQQGWTGQPPAPPGTSTLNGLSTVLVRVNGAGPWVTLGAGVVGPNDVALENTGAAWQPSAAGVPQNIVILAIP